MVIRPRASPNFSTDSEDETIGTTSTLRRSTRMIHPPSDPLQNNGETRGQSYYQKLRHLEHSHNIIDQTAIKEKYDETEAYVLSMFMNEIMRKPCLAQQYLLNEGLRRFGKRGEAAVTKEVKQLHD